MTNIFSIFIEQIEFVVSNNSFFLSLFFIIGPLKSEAKFNVSSGNV